VLQSYNIRTSEDPDHIIFSMQMLTQEYSLQPQAVKLPSYAYWLIGLGVAFVVGILLYIRKRAALQD